MCNQCSTANDTTILNRKPATFGGVRIKGRNGRHDVIVRRADRSMSVSLPTQKLARQVAAALDKVA